MSTEQPDLNFTSKGSGNINANGKDLGPQPTTEQLAASIGCEPDKIVRSVLNRRRTLQEGKQIWTSFVERDEPQNEQGDTVAVFETVWPQ